MLSNPFSAQGRPSAITVGEADPAPARNHRGPTSFSGLARPALSVVALGLVFLAGFLPMRFIARRHAAERDSARRALRLVQLEALAAAGTVDARRGQYDWARQSIQIWFTALRAELDRGSSSCLSPSQQAALGPLLKRQEELMLALGRGEPSCVANLTTVYLACRDALRRG